MRTQEEIIERFKNSSDMLGTQQWDLVELLTYENAKEFLRKEFIESVEKWEDKWEQKTETKTTILDYLPFAYSKAEWERGISAGRSMLHFKTWIWFDDEKFYNEIISDIDNYTDYGMPALDKISTHYGYIRK